MQSQKQHSKKILMMEITLLIIKVSQNSWFKSWQNILYLILNYRVVKLPPL